VATPMEYDTLREIFSSAGAALHRLKVTYGVGVRRKHKASQYWISTKMRSARNPMIGFFG